ncbi:hypothetical protein DFH08DRAFT_854014 [Mycena albidolilacea]|uniref:Uncharacterized protein n=1 Tax=Mycena albidolilacea TaxID=1033008 RepID=A0AAD7AF57_9AGAR|nr:hypothetical protein DFH08DRAFT_854014 [Mycena albidolilacea]
MKLLTALRFTSSMAEVTCGARGDAADDTCGAGAQRTRQSLWRPHPSQQIDRLGTAPRPRNQVRGRDGGGTNK